jgi:hypothetical protein
VSLEVKSSGIEDIQELLVDRTLDNAQLRQTGPTAKPPTSERKLRGSQWYTLKRLSFASNFLTFVPSTPWETSFTNVVHLDLSSNLLVTVPSGTRLLTGA